MLKKVFLVIISLMCTSFIFYNSSQVGSVSHNRSYSIVNKIIDVLKGEEVSNDNKKMSESSAISENNKLENSDDNINYSTQKAINAESKNNEASIKNKILYKIRNINYIKNLSRSDLDHIIRKIAHMSEFALLGLSLCFLFNSFNFNKYNTIIYALFLLLFIAVTDETIQRNVVGRESSTVDVLIDFIGGIISSMFFCVLKSYSRLSRGKNT